MYNIPLSVLEFSKLELNYCEGTPEKVFTLNSIFILFFFQLLLDGNDFNYQELHEIPGTKLTIGSMVEVSDSAINSDLYGVIRWIGYPPNSSNVMVGIEVEDDQNLRGLSISDGTYNGTR